MLVSFWMQQRLTREINELEMQVMRKTQQLAKHQRYASRLGASSNLTLNNIAGLSPEILPRATMFANYSDQASSMSAMQQLQQMKMMGRVPFTGNPAQQMQLEFSAFNQFKQEALKALKEQEPAALNEVEKEIQLELNDLEMQLDIKKKQQETYKQKSKDDIDRMVPKFGG